MISSKELQRHVYDHWSRRFNIPIKGFSQSATYLKSDKELSGTGIIILYLIQNSTVANMDPQLTTRLGISPGKILEYRLNQEGIQQMIMDSQKAEDNLHNHSIRMEDSGSYSYLDGSNFIPFSTNAGQVPLRLDPKHNQELIRNLCNACPPEDVEDAELGEDDEPDSVCFGHIINGKLTAYAGLRYWDKIFGDIGVLTHPDFRHRGLARSAASVLCSWCLEKDVIPMYRVSTENLASSRIPVALGFTRMVEIDVLKVES